MSQTIKTTCDWCNNDWPGHMALVHKAGWLHLLSNSCIDWDNLSLDFCSFQCLYNWMERGKFRVDGFVRIENGKEVHTEKERVK